MGEGLGCYSPPSTALQVIVSYLGRSLEGGRDILLVDEPSAGLDPQTRLLLWEIIREYNHSGKTILLTTHNMEEADALCQRLAIIDHARSRQ